MGIYEELVERGLIAQVTNEDQIKEMINNGKATFCFLVHAGIFAARGKNRLCAIITAFVVIKCSLSNIHSCLL